MNFPDDGWKRLFCPLCGKEMQADRHRNISALSNADNWWFGNVIWIW